MFPPKVSGTSEERASPAAGATPTVPSMGAIGSSSLSPPACAWNATVRRSLSTS